MTSRQKSKLAMYLSVLSIFERNRSVWQDLPAFASAQERFAGKVESIEALTRVQRRHTGGVADRKRSLREQLCERAHEIACAGRACALSGNRPDLAGQLDYSLTDLRIGRDTLCIERCRAIYEAAAAQGGELANFGVTAEKLSDLGRAISEFCEILNKPREIRAANKGITAQLVQEFKAADEILNNHLDNLMPQFRSTHPRFVAGFAQGRIMNGAAIDTGHGIQPEETTLD